MNNEEVDGFIKNAEKKVGKSFAEFLALAITRIDECSSDYPKLSDARVTQLLQVLIPIALLDDHFSKREMTVSAKEYVSLLCEVHRGRKGIDPAPEMEILQ